MSGGAGSRDVSARSYTLGHVSTPALLELPPTVAAGTIATDRGEFAALEAGSGPLVLLVPGWTGSKEDFLSVLDPLASRGYRTVAIDLRGQYQSRGLDDPGAYSIDALADDLRAIVAALEESRAHVVGHSLGGLVSQSLAVRHTCAVRSLTLLCSGPGALPPDRHALLHAMADAIDTHGLELTWQAKRAYERTQGAPEVPPSIEEFLHRRFLANHPLALREMTMHLTSAPDRTEAVAATAIPKLVAYGEHDDGWPPQVQAEMARRLRAKSTVIHNAAHSPAVEQPTATAALLARFWGQTTDEQGPRTARSDG